MTCPQRCDSRNVQWGTQPEIHAFVACLVPQSLANVCGLERCPGKCEREAGPKDTFRVTAALETER